MNFDLEKNLTTFIPMQKPKQQIDVNKMVKENLQLKNVITIYNKLNEMLVNKQNLIEILKECNRLVGREIALFDLEGDLCYSSSQSALLEKFILEYKKKYANWKFREIRKISLDSGGILISPIMVDQEVFQYCGFFYHKDEIITEEEKMILERISTICSIVLINKKAMFDANERMKAVLFEKLIIGEITDYKELLRELKLLNIYVQESYHIAYISFNYKDKSSDDNLQMFVKVYREIVTFFKKLNLEVLIVQRGQGVLCFVPISFDDPLLDGAPEKFLHSIDKYQDSIICRVGISSTTNTLECLNQSIKEAIIAERVSTSNETVMQFGDIGILGALLYTEHHQLLRSIVERDLLEILPEEDLMHTLYYFLDNGGNLEKTAKLTNLSVGGVRYRLQNIKELLQIDLRCPKIRFQLLLNLKVLKVLNLPAI
ncbi:MAG: helix-turn-helix domain-containing protein [Solibacillus sp.]|uniref:PucR family transcriptional regulator n=1 Tax=Solibacillus sp. TaxID=1909654 RepID=UPI003315B8DF